MKNGILFAATMLAAMATPAVAESWRAASLGEEYPAVVVLVDADSISRSGNKATFRAQSLFEKALEGGATRSIEVMEADCDGKRYRIFNSKFYVDEKFSEEDDSISDYYSVTPGSVNQGMIFTACGARDYQSDAIADPINYANDYFLELALSEGV